MRLSLLMSLLLAAATTLAAADEPTVTARSDARRIGEADSLTLTIAVEGRTDGLVEEPDLSGMADFTIAAGPSVSSSTSMIWRNGQASSSTSRQYSYILMPRRRGTLTIPTVTVKIGNRSYRTDPINVEVVEGRVQSAPPSRSRATPPRARPGDPGEVQGDLIVESTVSRDRVYLGEQVLVTYSVLTQVDLADVPSPQQLPSYTGFWVEEIPVDPRATLRQVTRDGKEYTEFVLMKKALFPTASGRLKIESTAFGLPVKVKSRDPFDALFFTPTRMVFRQTTPITIDVAPLPESGRPASFSGAVGQFRLGVKADRTETTVGEAIGVQVQVEGTGNIRVMGAPTLPPLPDYRTYDPKVAEHREIREDRVTGEKSWDYVLTPLLSGRQDIPPIRFSWFDPVKRDYVEQQSDPIPIQVAKAAAGDPSAAVRREVVASRRDIRFIKPAASLLSASAPYHRSYTFAAAMAIPVLLNAGLLLAVSRRRHQQSNAGLIRQRRAPGFARRRLKTARALMNKGEPVAFHQEVARALTGYLADTLGASASGLTHQRIAQLLAERGVSETLRADLARRLEACDYARFAPDQAAPRAMEGVLEDAGLLIARLQREMTSGGRA